MHLPTTYSEVMKAFHDGSIYNIHKDGVQTMAWSLNMHFDIDDDIGALLSRLFEYCSPPPITPEHYRPPIPKRPSQATWHAHAKKPRTLSMN